MEYMETQQLQTRRRRGQSQNFGFLIAAVTGFIVLGLLGVVGVQIIESSISTAAAQNNTSAAISFGGNVLSGLIQMASWMPLVGMVIAAAFVLGVIYLFTRLSQR